MSRDLACKLTSMSAENDDRARLEEDRQWQKRMLPWMVGGLLLLSLVFFGATIWHYSSIQRWLAYEPRDLQTALRELESRSIASGDARVAPVDAAYRDWYVRTYLEAYALDHRYRQNAAVIYSRVWNGYMGFLTGMVLALSGCVFILGKLREGVHFTGEAASAKWTLITSSPGVVLALAGAVLVALALKLTIKVESEDRPVYLPALVEVVGDATTSAPAKTRPRDLSAGAASPVAEGGAAEAGPKRELPPGLRDKLKPTESAPTHPRDAAGPSS